MWPRWHACCCGKLADLPSLVVVMMSPWLVLTQLRSPLSGWAAGFGSAWIRRGASPAEARRKPTKPPAGTAEPTLPQSVNAAHTRPHSTPIQVQRPATPPAKPALPLPVTMQARLSISLFWVLWNLLFFWFFLYVNQTVCIGAGEFRLMKAKATTLTHSWKKIGVNI